MTTASASEARRSSGRGLALSGVVLAILAIAAFFAQVFVAHQLRTPWFLPIATTVGVLMVGAALWQARSVWRWMALMVVLLLAGGEWLLVLGMPLPEYTGPVAAGKTFPAFVTTQADGSTFTDGDLRGDQNHVLVFFRGRW